MTHPEPAGPASKRPAGQAYKRYAAEAGRRLRAAEEARARLARAERERTAAYESVERELARLDGLEERARGIWRELTTRFGPQAAGELPEPARHPKADQDPAELLRDAHRRAREPVHYPMARWFVLLVVLGFAVAAALAVAGLELSRPLRPLGQVRLVVAYGPAFAAPLVGLLTARTWIRMRTSHEEREYAVDTAIAGAFGGGGVWLIMVVLLIVHMVT